MNHDLTGATWRSSTYSQANGGECIEWAPNVVARGVVPVRDSKDPAGPALAFSLASWASFVDAVKRGDLPTA
ncbi:DUF397 domain-containing protein [Streptomyces sp. NPDC054933]